MQTIDYTFGDTQFKASFWCPSTENMNPVIIYIHGGGLMYGNRNDLPQAYLNMFLKAGYPLLALDYYLAPEKSLSDIVSSTQAGIQYFTTHFADFGLSSSNYILFGRSAGAYLSCQLLLGTNIPMPRAFIDFYGFANISAPAFKRPNTLYNSYPLISSEQFESMLSKTPIINSSIESRFLLYVYARQSQKWSQLILQQDSEEQFKSNQVDLFPPTYICHSTSDPDVPFSNAISLKAKIPNATLTTVSDKMHDFDRSVTPSTIQEYQKVITWLNTIQ